MNLLRVDTTKVRKPPMVISCATQQTIENIARELTQKGDIQHYVTIVTQDHQYTAVDNLEVLDAAILAKQPQIHALNLGDLDSMLVHIKLQSVRPMINPIRLRLALATITDKTSLSFNSYLEGILKVSFDDDILLLLANLVDEVFQAGIRLTIPLTFLSSLSRLDIPSQKIIIEKTSHLHQELKQRYFKWPDNAIFEMMLHDDMDGNPNSTKTKTNHALRESISKKFCHFNCSSCGTCYGLVNDDICILKERDGCFVVQDSVGTVLHPIPPSEVKFLGVDENTSLRFSKYKSIADIKKLKIKGPFVLVRLNTA